MWIDHELFIGFRIDECLFMNCCCMSSFFPFKTLIPSCAAYYIYVSIVFYYQVYHDMWYIKMVQNHMCNKHGQMCIYHLCLHGVWNFMVVNCLWPFHVGEGLSVTRAVISLGNITKSVCDKLKHLVHHEMQRHLDQRRYCSFSQTSRMDSALSQFCTSMKHNLLLSWS